MENRGDDGDGAAVDVGKEQQDVRQGTKFRREMPKESGSACRDCTAAGCIFGRSLPPEPVAGATVGSSWAQSFHRAMTEWGPK